MTDRKRILFLADINSIHTERWVKNLIAKGFEIGVFSLSVKTSSWADELAGVTYKCYGLTDDLIRSGRKWGKISYFAATKDVRAFCTIFDPGIVHAHYASSYGMLAARLKFPKTVLSLWGSDVYEFPKRSFLHKMLFKKALRSATVVCSTSKDMAREAERYVKMDFQITPFGVDIETFIPGDSTNELLTIGTVKSLEEVYGIDRLLRLFSEFSRDYKKPSRLLIYGKGSKEQELRELSKELNIENHVEFKGYVEADNLVKAFNSLDIFVALSRRESFGVAVLEAQACGVPVLVSNVGGLPEVVGDKSGFIIDGDDLKRGVEVLIDFADSKKRAQMSIEARTFVEENYSEEVCVNKLIEVYDQI